MGTKRSFKWTRLIIALKEHRSVLYIVQGLEVWGMTQEFREPQKRSTRVMLRPLWLCTRQNTLY